MGITLLGETGKLFYLLLKGSVYVLAPGKEGSLTDFSKNMVTEGDMRSSKKRATKFDKINPPNMKKRESIEENLLEARTSPKRATFLETKDPSKNTTVESRAIIEASKSKTELEESPIISPDEIKKLYPGHCLLNIMKQGSHFGDIALTNRGFRYNIYCLCS